MIKKQFYQLDLYFMYILLYILIGLWTQSAPLSLLHSPPYPTNIVCLLHTPENPVSVMYAFLNGYPVLELVAILCINVKKSKKKSHLAALNVYSMSTKSVLYASTLVAISNRQG